MKSDHFLIRLQILVALLLASILIFACQRLGLIELAYNLASVSKPGSVIVEENFRDAIPAFLGKLLLVLLFFGSSCYKPASLMVPAFVKYFSRDYPPFLSPLKDNTEDKLSPYNPNTPFKGRKEELTRLHEFAAKPQQFLYWTLAGPSGVGKTRLAIEWARNLTKRRTWVGGKVWDAGLFEATSKEETWLNWQPRRPTVILIDEFSTCREALRPMLAHLNANTDLKHPLRVLLIDWYEAEDTIGFSINETLQTSRNSHDPLSCVGLDFETLSDWIKSETGENRKWTDEELQRLWQESQGLPLVVRVILGEKSTHLDSFAAADTFDWWATRRHHKFLEKQGKDEKDKTENILAFSAFVTYVGGIDDNNNAETAFTALLKHPPAMSEVLTVLEVDKAGLVPFLPPISPESLSWAVVRRELEHNPALRSQESRAAFAFEGWRLGPEKVARLLVHFHRAMPDWRLLPTLDAFPSLETLDAETARLISYHWAMVRYSLWQEQPDAERGANFWTQLQQTFQERPDNVGLRNVWISALATKLWQLKDDPLHHNQGIALYQTELAPTLESVANDKESVLIYANALICAMSLFGTIPRLEDMEARLQELRNLAGHEALSAIPDIQLHLAMGLVNATLYSDTQTSRILN